MISLKQAKTFAKKELEKGLPKLEVEYVLEHSKFIMVAAKELIREKNIRMDISNIEIAAFLHDIGYIIDEKTHAEKSLEIIKKSKLDINKIVVDCILNHSSSAIPHTPEGKIFQLADKLFIFYPEFIKKLIELETKEGKLNKKQILLKIDNKMKKYLDLFSDAIYKKISNSYYKKFRILYVDFF